MISYLSSPLLASAYYAKNFLNKLSKATLVRDYTTGKIDTYTNPQAAKAKVQETALEILQELLPNDCNRIAEVSITCSDPMELKHFVNSFDTPITNQLISLAPPSMDNIFCSEEFTSLYPGKGSTKCYYGIGTLTFRDYRFRDHRGHSYQEFTAAKLFVPLKEGVSVQVKMSELPDLIVKKACEQFSLEFFANMAMRSSETLIDSLSTQIERYTHRTVPAPVRTTLKTAAILGLGYATQTSVVPYAISRTMSLIPKICSAAKEFYVQRKFYRVLAQAEGRSSFIYEILSGIAGDFARKEILNSLISLEITDFNLRLLEPKGIKILKENFPNLKKLVIRKSAQSICSDSDIVPILSLDIENINKLNLKALVFEGCRICTGISQMGNIDRIIFKNSIIHGDIDRTNFEEFSSPSMRMFMRKKRV